MMLGRYRRIRIFLIVGDVSNASLMCHIVLFVKCSMKGKKLCAVLWKTFKSKLEWNRGQVV